jgi:SpoVK/Ycf46/Vps4 family AAA+-type ATPase
MQELNDLELVLKSHTPIIVIESPEEQRLLELFAQLGMRLPHPSYKWTIIDGLQRLVVDFGPQKFTSAPPEVLKHIRALNKPGYFLLLDFHPYMEDPLHIRLIKEIAHGHDQIPRTLIFLSHSFPIPKELKHLTARFELRLPDRSTIKRLIQEEARHWRDSLGNGKVGADAEAVERLASNLTGVTTSDARQLIRKAIRNDGAITHSDLPEVMKAKYELIGGDGVVSFEYDTAQFSDVAGLTNLKRWLDQRRKAFAGSSGALDRPKGIMLLGVQGGGKSLAAKAVAGTYGVPLLRLDFGALYDKYYGETEKNLRRALQTAEVMAPCVLWMDEIEKGIAEGGSDDGLSQRVLGTLLTWMAEQGDGVFIVATANNIERLPPELIRKGRMDEIFFVDLPDPEVRREIFNIHLRRRNLAPSGFDLDLLADKSLGFTGAEIEQAIVSSLYAAQAQEAPVETDHLIAELQETRPLSVVMAEQIEQLRGWAAERTVPAG